MNIFVGAKEMGKTETENWDGTEVVEQEVKRPGKGPKKVLVISGVMCGGIAFLLWATFGFPRKLKNPRIFKEKTCAWNATLCPQGWNRIHNKCFFLSEQEKTWRDSQANCMAYHGTLVIFSSQNEVDILTYYMGPSSYWIGLKKQNASKHWIWANGDALSNRFTINGNEKCAFIFKKGISSANCKDMKKYICSREGVCP
uniref:C-type lectin domain family 2 member A n=1 Tax=Molossus molossus TaxID=27622 RepID=A0A7J8FWG9_MOLMO|nr:C-type lectin domain family 2 member A [Molossus molossus]